ncbi:MAG: ABC transporter permease, partial [Clostridiales bacterium]|nr:ABC transporter permease [Clostridiales bacterium]
EPISALRSGITTHNFKRNHIPLEKTKAPLNLALALKTTLSGVKHNITVCITMLVLSLVLVFSGLMTKNVIMDMTPFVDLIMGEMADSCISVDIEKESEFLQNSNADSRVEKIYLYHSVNIAHVGGAELMATICDDFSTVNNKSVVFDGRFPKYDNELALGAKYANENGIKIGNEIEITVNGKTEKFLVCGFTQISNYLGRDCLMTRQGYERLGTLAYTNYYINLSKGTDIDAFNAEMKDLFDGYVNTVINIQTTVESASVVYVSLMTIIVIAMLVFSVIIVAFVLFLLVRTMLNNKMRDYGILKSLGFTTRQLILQTAMSFMPAVILSTVIGLVVCCLIINPLMSLFLSSIGIVKCTFALPIGLISATGLGLVVLSFGLACLLSLRIKKIAPRSLLVGE